MICFEGGGGGGCQGLKWMSSNSPCAACKLLRRKCTPGCVFAPYFPPDNPRKFSSVHRVFGASNVAKILGDLAPAQREEAANSLAFEAEWRICDPVKGCAGQIDILHYRLRQVNDELNRARKELAALGGSIALGPAALGPLLPQQALPQHHYHHQYHHHHDHHLHGVPSSSSAAVPHGIPRMGLDLAAPAGESQHGQMLMQQQQPPPSQSAEAQQAAMAEGMGAREQQEAMRSYEQQQELARFNAGFCDGGGRGYGGHHGSGVAMVAVAALPHSGLALVPAQSLEVPFMAQPLYYSEQQQMQAQHQASESNDGRSGLSPSS